MKILKPIKQKIKYKLSEIADVAREFWQVAKEYRVIAFNGDMGAGKTTFIHSLCDYLKVQDAISSPTFALINEYHFNDEKAADRKIYHMDLYRISSEEEAMQAGIEDAIMDRDVYCFVEWAEKAITLFPKPYLNVSIHVTEDDERILSYEVIV